MWYIFSGGILVTIGDVFLKYWVDSNKGILFALGIFMYFVGEILLALSYKHFNIAVATGLMVLLNLIVLTFVSVLLFRQTLNIYQIIGICLACLSIILLEM